MVRRRKWYTRSIKLDKSLSIMAQALGKVEVGSNVSVLSMMTEQHQPPTTKT